MSMPRFIGRDNIFYLTDLMRKLDWLSVAQAVSEQSGTWMFVRFSSSGSIPWIPCVLLILVLVAQSSQTKVCFQLLPLSQKYLLEEVTTGRLLWMGYYVLHITFVLKWFLKKMKFNMFSFKKENPIFQIKSWSSWHQFWHLLQYS